MYLYCITNGDHCKFGFSQDPHSRLRSLQTGSSGALQLVESVAVPAHSVRELEKLLHREIGLHRRLKGEWFSIDSSQARLLMQWFAIRYCDC